MLSLMRDAGWEITEDMSARADARRGQHLRLHRSGKDRSHRDHPRDRAVQADRQHEGSGRDRLSGAAHTRTKCAASCPKSTFSSLAAPGSYDNIVDAAKRGAQGSAGGLHGRYMTAAALDGGRSRLTPVLHRLFQNRRGLLETPAPTASSPSCADATACREMASRARGGACAERCRRKGAHRHSRRTSPSTAWTCRSTSACSPSCCASCAKWISHGSVCTTSNPDQITRRAHRSSSLRSRRS